MHYFYNCSNSLVTKNVLKKMEYFNKVRNSCSNNFTGMDK